MDWTEVSKPKKKKVVKKAGPGTDDQKYLMKEMQGFKNWSEKETRKEIPSNTGEFEKDDNSCHHNFYFIWFNISIEKFILIFIGRSKLGAGVT